MSTNTSIEWTKGDDGSPGATWNPLLGCERVSPGCERCYAITTATIRAGNPHPKVAAAFEGLTERRDGRLDWTGRINLLPDRLTQPLRWRKPKRIFVNSQSDLFHKDVPDEYIARVFAVMHYARQHTFQLLTKRHARMRSLLNSPTFQQLAWDTANDMDPDGNLCRGFPPDRWPLPNVWVGVSVEDQQWADIRIPALLDTPAVVRWVSAEPLLGPVDLAPGLSENPTAGHCHDIDGMPWHASCARCGSVDWVVCGGESGPGARPAHPDWFRSLRDQCTSAGVPYFYKQAGNWQAIDDSGPDGWRARRETDWYVRRDGYAWPLAEPHGTEDGTEVLVRNVGKKAAGRLLDGRTWDQYPTTVLAVTA